MANGVSPRHIDVAVRAQCGVIIGSGTHILSVCFAAAGTSAPGRQFQFGWSNCGRTALIRRRQAPRPLDRPLWSAPTFERPSAYDGCTSKPAVGVAMFWPIVCLEVADSTRAALSAFPCPRAMTSILFPIAGVVRERRPTIDFRSTPAPIRGRALSIGQAHPCFFPMTSQFARSP